MTDKARELLERVLNTDEFEDYGKLLDEISAYLAEPEVKHDQ